jgi:hypothetical protein
MNFSGLVHGKYTRTVPTAIDSWYNARKRRGCCDTRRPDGDHAKSKSEATEAETAARARAKAEQGLVKSGISRQHGWNFW